MSSTWHGKTQCRKCSASLHVSLEPGEADGSGLAVVYCPACGGRTQVEVPAGYDARSTIVTHEPK